METIRETFAAGRKFKLAVLCLLIMLAGFAVAGTFPAFAVLYSDLTMAVIGTFFVYCGGNVGSAAVFAKKAMNPNTSKTKEND